MAKKQKPTTAPADDALKDVSDHRFPEATRKNNPPAKIAAEGYVPPIPKAEYLYSPRRPPELRFVAYLAVFPSSRLPAGSSGEAKRNQLRENWRYA
jgi:hypothetical protein